MTYWTNLLIIYLSLTYTMTNVNLFHLWHNSILFDLHRNVTVPRNYLRYSDGTIKHCVSKNLKHNIFLYLISMIECIESFQLRAKCQHAKTDMFYRGQERKKRHCRHVIPAGGLFQTMDTFNEKFTAKDKTEPFGEVCITAAYSIQGNSKVYSNMQALTSSTIEKIRYRFDVSERLGLNVTFLTFSLSDMCVIDHPFRSGQCFYHKDTEHVLIDQGDPDPIKKLYFCFKRPQWSVYFGNTTLIDYYPCKVCINHKSSIVFSYQVLDRDLIQTKSDTYRNIFYGGAAWSTWRIRYYSTARGSYVPYSSICLSSFHPCSHQILEFFIRGEKYEKLSLTRIGREGQHVIVSQYFDTSAIELKHRDVLRLNSFYCLIQVVVCTKSDGTDVLHYASWVETNISK